MSKISPAVRQETLYIASLVGVISLLLQAVFLLIHQWDYTVLLGNLLGGGAAVLNFFLMGLTVQSALGQGEEEARRRMRASQRLRTLMMFVLLGLGVLLPCFSAWTTLIPAFFPRVAIAMRPLFHNKEGTDEN